MLPDSLVLGRSDDAVLALVGGRAYTTGVKLSLLLRLRHRPPFGAVTLHHGVFGPHGAPPGPGADADPDGWLLIGVELADGRRATNMRPRPAQFPPDADALIFQQTGGGGGDIAYDIGFWLSPLPPDGPLHLIVRYTALGIDETSVVLDGTAVAAAGRNADVLWPLPPVQQWAEPSAPHLPDHGWSSEQRSSGARGK